MLTTTKKVEGGRIVLAAKLASCQTSWQGTLRQTQIVEVLDTQYSVLSTQRLSARLPLSAADFALNQVSSKVPSPCVAVLLKDDYHRGPEEFRAEPAPLH
jgi:hypothetical protein